MELRDSRRLPGANFLWRRPGAVVEVNFAKHEAGLVAPMTKSWCAQARRMLDALGWQAQATHVRELGIPLESRSDDCVHSVAFALSAPLDAMYAATSIAEFALEAATAELVGPPLAAGAFAEAQQRIAKEIADEVNPPLLSLREEAMARDICFLSDDDLVSVGMGDGSLTWPVGELPAASDVDWSAVHNIPHVVVTGTNGKSTTVRLLASIANCAGLTPGICSTDWVRVGDEVVDDGDWSGPGGARMVLQHPRVTFALLETARGGLMRRGLALEKADLCAILNISDDHLSEWGTPDLESLTDAKFIVGRVAGRIVLNADDEQLVAGAIRNLADETEVIWFSLDSDSSLVAAHLEAGGRAVVLDGEMICLRGDWPAVRGPSNNVASVKDIPMTLGGAARYNVSNALAAVAIAADAAIDIRFIAAGLGAFESDADQNPGRLNEFHFDGIQVLVDFAHNPGGMAAFFGLRKHLNPKRALFSIGQAGDRDEKSTRSMTRTAWEAGPDLLVLKELTLHLRGRELGELPAIMESELNNLGAPTDSWCHAPNELASVHMALEWAQPGDLLMLLAHDSRDEILELLAARQAASKDPV